MPKVEKSLFVCIHIHPAAFGLFLMSMFLETCKLLVNGNRAFRTLPCSCCRLGLSTEKFFTSRRDKMSRGAGLADIDPMAIDQSVSYGEVNYSALQWWFLILLPPFFPSVSSGGVRQHRRSVGSHLSTERNGCLPASLPWSVRQFQDSASQVTHVDKLMSESKKTHQNVSICEFRLIRKQFLLDVPLKLRFKIFYSQLDDTDYETFNFLL